MGAKRPGRANTFNIKVVTGSAKPRVEEMPDGTYRVHVSASPEKGKANAELIQLMARYLGVAKADISIIRGRTSRAKTLRVDQG